MRALPTLHRRPVPQTSRRVRGDECDVDTIGSHGFGSAAERPAEPIVEPIEADNYRQGNSDNDALEQPLERFASEH